MLTNSFSKGDLVKLQSGISGIVIEVGSVGAKNTVGRSGVVEIIEVLTEHGNIGRVMSHQAEIIEKVDNGI
jgi:hypothetical protein